MQHTGGAMSILENMWDFAIHETEISKELNSYKKLAETLDVPLSDLIQARTALEINRLREALLSMWVLRHESYFSHADGKLAEYIANK